MAFFRSPLAFPALLALATPIVAQVPAVGALSPFDLRVEARSDPIGVDVVTPRLSWKLAGTSPRQTAYRILVATSPRVLAEERGDLWDSGEVDSAETVGIEYGGARLVSHQQCFWTVRVWDAERRPSPVSAVATFTVGVLDPAEWSESAWIGYDSLREVDDPDAILEDASWVAQADADPLDGPRGFQLYVARPQLPDRIALAELIVLADDKATCVLNGSTLFTDREGWRDATALEVTELVHAGENDIRIQVENDTRGPTGLLVHLRAVTEDGDETVVVTDASWRAGAPYENWHEGELDESGFAPVRELGKYGMQPWGRARTSQLRLPPVPHLRTSFLVDRPVRRALLYGTALGNVDFHLNGARVSDERFTPGWTDYTIRVPYRAWDVTSRLQQGENVLGALLADGWYSGYIGWGRVRDRYGKRPRARAMLRIELDDGTVQTIVSDPEWRAACGAIREADFLMGERYDAREALAGWAAPGVDASGWDRVEVGAEMEPEIGWHPGPPVVAVGEFVPVGITEPEPGRWTFDLGRNFAGVVRLRVTGAPGQEITLRFAERLNPDGTVYTTNLRGARAVDTYVCRGDGVEVWEPRFTFHGFQYVEVQGLTVPPTAETVTGVALSSDTPVVGSFECSEPMLNQLWSNVFWTQRANFIDVPTDCPQRDERLGWTGDAQVYVRTAALNCDVQAFFTKWLLDLADAQREDGQFPMVAPLKVAGADGGPAWSDAGTIVPWAMWEVYGDRRLLERQYPSMVRYVEFCARRSIEGVMPPAEFHCFGDWLSIDAPTPKTLIYTAYYAHSVDLVRRAAEVLGHAEDVVRFAALRARIEEAFVARFFGADGKVEGDTQCGYVLALAYDLIHGELAEQAAANLIANIEARGNHLSTGFIGTKDLMLVLSKIGREDVAYRLLMNDTFPSWGFSIRHGATSIWERWDGWTPEKGFQDPGMNSFAHYAFGAVYQWIAENVGGIRMADVGYRKVEIAPRPGGGLTWAKTRYDSVRGRIATSWRIDGDTFSLDVEIPANVGAIVEIPTADAGSVRESGAPLAERGIRVVEETPDTVELDVPPGTWRFTARR